MNVGDVAANDVVLPAELIDLRKHLALALCQTEGQTLRDCSLHTCKIILERGINNVNIAVGGTDYFLVMQLLDLGTLFFGFLDFLGIYLLSCYSAWHDGLDIGLVFLEADTVAGLKARPFPVGLGTGVFLMQKVVVPVWCEVPWTCLDAAPLLFFLLVMYYLLRIGSAAFTDRESKGYGQEYKAKGLSH